MDFEESKTLADKEPVDRQRAPGWGLILGNRRRKADCRELDRIQCDCGELSGIDQERNYYFINIRYLFNLIKFVEYEYGSPRAY